MVELTDNTVQQRYEIQVDGDTVYADYRLKDQVLELLYVYAPPGLRGTGAASRLMQGVMQEARKNEWKVKPICSYAAAWIDRHAEFSGMKS